MTQIFEQDGEPAHFVAACAIQENNSYHLGEQGERTSECLVILPELSQKGAKLPRRERGRPLSLRKLQSRFFILRIMGNMTFSSFIL